MQSFLQYRRFGKHVTRQYERDKSKAEALANSDASESTSPLSSIAVNAPQVAGTSDHVDTRDPEKGEHFSGQPIDVQNHAETQDSEKEEERQGFAPIKVPTAGRGAQKGGEVPENMSRTSTVQTKKSMGTALGTSLTGIEIRDRSTQEGGDGKVFVVGYEGENDIMNPHNWSYLTRFAATCVHCKASVRVEADGF